MTMCAAACSTTGLSEVAMTPFVPHVSAFIGVCVYLGLYVEPQGFVLCFHFSFCFINASVLCLLHTSASVPHACTVSFIWVYSLCSPRSSPLVPNKALLFPPLPSLTLTSVPFLSVNSIPTDLQQAFPSHMLLGPLKI